MGAGFRPLIHRYVGGLPAPHWSLAVLYLGGAVACLVVLVFPTSPDMLAAPKIGVAAVSLAGIAAVVALGRRLTRPMLYVGACVANVLVTFLVAEAHGAYGSTVAAFGYLWISLYCGLFFSLPAVAGQALLTTCGMGAALLIAGHPHATIAWLVASVTAVAFGALPQWLSSQLRSDARTDPLTGLLNRRGLGGLTRSSFARADASGDVGTVAFFDLDGFKRVNDESGHDVGDRLLTLTGQLVRSHVPPGAAVARVGGDELVSWIPQTTAEETAVMIAGVAKVAPTRFSAGFCERRRGESLDAVVRRASAAMREARREAGAAGRRGGESGRIVVSDGVGRGAALGRDAGVSDSGLALVAS